MCTAISYKTKDHYFGRNLDLEYSYNEEIVITPRKFPLSFRMVKKLNEHYGIIGTPSFPTGFHCILMPSTKLVFQLRH